MSLDALTEQEAESFSRLQENADFRIFMATLGEDMAIMNQRLIKTDLEPGPENKLIGQLRFGTRLTDAIVTSKHTLHQHRQPKT